MVWPQQIILPIWRFAGPTMSPLMEDWLLTRSCAYDRPYFLTVRNVRFDQRPPCNTNWMCCFDVMKNRRSASCRAFEVCTRIPLSRVLQRAKHDHWVRVPWNELAFRWKQSANKMIYIRCSKRHYDDYNQFLIVLGRIGCRDRQKKSIIFPCGVVFALRYTRLT